MQEKLFWGLSAEGFHKIFYRDYGKPTGRNTLVCVHGLTRNSSDFHFLAKALMETRHIVAPDVVGRGKSDRFKDPKFYDIPQYLSDMNTLMQQVNEPSYDWLGTSMGGLMGMILASLPNNRIRRLSLDDVGPVLSGEALTRIRTYASIPLEFPDLTVAEQTLKMIYASFGPMNSEQWKYMVDHSLRLQENGTYTLDYDHNAIAAAQDTDDIDQDVTFWEYWDQIKCAVLVVHVRYSDILSEDTLDQMRSRGPKFDYVMIEDTGHAPSLMPDDQVAVIKNWLNKTQSLVMPPVI